MEPKIAGVALLGLIGLVALSSDPRCFIDHADRDQFRAERAELRAELRAQRDEIRSQAREQLNETREELRERRDEFRSNSREVRDDLRSNADELRARQQETARQHARSLPNSQ